MTTERKIELREYALTEANEYAKSRASGSAKGIVKDAEVFYEFLTFNKANEKPDEYKRQA